MGDGAGSNDRVRESLCSPGLPYDERDGPAVTTAFLFDLDGTLVDSVYQHVRAWHLALRDEGIDLSVWRIHRKIWMSGGLLTNQLLRELGREVDPGTIADLRTRHAEHYLALSHEVRPL